ncbi:hypothetical protein [Aquirhabdus sp.]|uniref:hypothetical protein n=1 Tax=Aquirhabdus sp. TaxID=2824160 RepID=UPI00396C6C94
MGSNTWQPKQGQPRELTIDHLNALLTGQHNTEEASYSAGNALNRKLLTQQINGSDRWQHNPYPANSPYPKMQTMSDPELGDVTGGDMQVTVWQPAGWGGSSFGHASSSVNGTSYSYGHDSKMHIQPVADYNRSNEFRSGMGLNIPLSPIQDSIVSQYLKSYDKTAGPYNPLLNNCTTPIQKALGLVGINVNTVFPVSLGNALLDKNVVNGTIDHPKIKPSKGSSAPWAR